MVLQLLTMMQVLMMGRVIGQKPLCCTQPIERTISLLHFQNCFDSFERMSQVQQPVFKRRVKALSKAGSFYQELGGREGRGGWVLVTQTGIERFFLFGF